MAGVPQFSLQEPAATKEGLTGTQQNHDSLVSMPSRFMSVAASFVLSAIWVLNPQQPAAARAPQPSPGAFETSILLYHRFGPVVHDEMTVRTATFRTQVEYLKQHGYQIVPLRMVVSHLLGKGLAPPAHSVVITVDDGHASVFSEMLPIVRENRMPVTLFIYPSAISNASYAMKWDQLTTLQATGLFDIQSHTYWHPNFKTERKRLSPDAYQSFLTMQFTKPRTTLKSRLGVDADMLAWPFGIYDDDLIAKAHEAGYVSAFTLDRRPVTSRERMMALPRYLVLDSDSGARFASMLPKQ